jgi:16S rRNA (uracil1498-N3)-methyltransferase
MTGAVGHHYARVLRVGAGEPIPVASGGQGYLARVLAVDAREGTVQLRVEERLPDHETATRLYLVQGLPKGDKMDAILQHNTEVGVSGFLLFTSRRSVVKLDARKAEDKLQRWRRVAAEAASQSQRDRIPTVDIALDFVQVDQWCRERQPDAILFLDEDAGEGGLGQRLRELPGGNTPCCIVLVAGPEGGWDDAERAAWCNELGAVRTSLGRRILRTETAGLAAASAVLHYFGDLGG